MLKSFIASFHCAKAYISLCRQSYAEAEQEYRKALALDPQSEVAYIGLGGVYASQERYAEAEEEYKQAVAIDPNHANAHKELDRMSKLS